VAEAALWAPAEAPNADAILSGSIALSVGIVTADCIPILAATSDGRHVAAIHAGWRGLADGVIEAGLSALRDVGESSELIVAMGPGARACCYEIDETVRVALGVSYSKELDLNVLTSTAAGHFQLDLARLATRVVEKFGVDSAQVGTAHRVCTICDPTRFESYRRDGETAGRLRHFIAPRVPDRVRVDSPEGSP